jgi:hypothetical protein
VTLSRAVAGRLRPTRVGIALLRFRVSMVRRSRSSSVSTSRVAIVRFTSTTKKGVVPSGARSSITASGRAPRSPGGTSVVTSTSVHVEGRRSVSNCRDCCRTSTSRSAGLSGYTGVPFAASRRRRRGAPHVSGACSAGLGALARPPPGSIHGCRMGAMIPESDGNGPERLRRRFRIMPVQVGFLGSGRTGRNRPRSADCGS